MKTGIILLVLAFIGTYILHGMGININNAMALFVIIGSLLFFCDWCFNG